MPRGYRLAIIALGLTLALGAQAQPTPQEKPIVGVQQEQEGAAHRNGDPGQSNGNPDEVVGEASPRIDEADNAVNSDAVAKENAKYPDCEFHTVDECDLAAQQSMAQSTRWMNYAAWVAAFLTLCGVLLLTATLLYTKSAAVSAKLMVGEAEKTTAAARAAVGEAKSANKIAADAAKAAQDAFRESMVATDRAWIKVDVEITEPLVFGDGQVSVGGKVTVFNVGKSPATHVSTYFKLFPDIVDAAYEADALVNNVTARKYVMTHVGYGRILFPGEDFSVELEAELPLNQFLTRLEERQKNARERDDGIEVNFIRPALLVGAAYALAGDRHLRHTLIPYEIFAKDEKHPGWNGADDALFPEGVLLEKGYFTGHIN